MKKKLKTKRKINPALPVKSARIKILHSEHKDDAEVPIHKSYYAVIPADVRYHKKLPVNAKLLYGEITALCNGNTYCWVKNSYFAGLYVVSERMIQNWISQLQEEGLVRVSVEDGSKSKIELSAIRKYQND